MNYPIVYISIAMESSVDPEPKTKQSVQNNKKTSTHQPPSATCPTMPTISSTKKNTQKKHNSQGMHLILSIN